MIRFAYMEEFDTEFIRWTGNLFRRFVQEGSVAVVRQNEAPDFIIASVWRAHDFPKDIPVVLISNENWEVFKPHHDVSRYHAVFGILPPPLQLGNVRHFIPYPFESVYYDCSVDELYALRAEFLKAPREKFCCFVTSNKYFGEMKKTREEVFGRIHGWKAVDSAGLELNNVGYLAPRGFEYLRWIAQYRYMICLENSKTSGYITEKAFQSWIAGTIPVYDGGSLDKLNPEAFINASGDYMRELQDLESSRLLYTQRQNVELYREKVSLEPFEARFREVFRL